MKIIDKEQIAQMESRYRATFINSLAGVKQVLLIGTKSNEGLSNLAIFNSLIHIGANPPLWGIICRPNTVNRDTLNNITATNFYTINYVQESDYQKAHQTSAKYPTTLSEFDACGFNEHYLPNFKAPFVAEAPVKIGMKLEEVVNLSINNTILIIGSIQQIELNEEIIAPDGFVGLHLAKTLASSGLDAYYETTLLNRLTYAQPDSWPSEK